MSEDRPTWAKDGAIEELRRRETELRRLLREVRHHGLIYWEPATRRGAEARARMMAEIDDLLRETIKPV